MASARKTLRRKRELEVALNIRRKVDKMSKKLRTFKRFSKGSSEEDMAPGYQFAEMVKKQESNWVFIPGSVVKSIQIGTDSKLSMN